MSQAFNKEEPIAEFHTSEETPEGRVETYTCSASHIQTLAKSIDHYTVPGMPVGGGRVVYDGSSPYIKVKVICGVNPSWSTVKPVLAATTDKYIAFDERYFVAAADDLGDVGAMKSLLYSAYYIAQLQKDEPVEVQLSLNITKLLAQLTPEVAEEVANALLQVMGK